MSYIKNKRVLHCIVNLGGSDGVPIVVNSELEMEKILFNANSEDYDKIYHYTGETTDNYEQGAYYVLREYDSGSDDGPKYQEKIIAANGEYVADSGYVAMSKVIVSVPGEIVDPTNIPEVESIDNPTETSPAVVNYDGELYLLVKEN